MADGIDLDVELDKVFDTPPEGFTAARNALAKALKAEKRSAEAAEVTALKKPNRLVWALNQLSLNGEDVLDTMVEVADDVRNERVEDFRAAVADLRQAVNDAARVAAAYLDPARPTDRADLAQALMAVVADEDATALLGDRRLVDIPMPDAFGLGLVAVPSGPAKEKASTRAKPRAEAAGAPDAAPADRPPDQLAVRRATKRQQEAAKEADAATRALARAEKARSTDAEALRDADAELDDAKAAVVEAEAVLDAARKALDRAEATAAAALEAQERTAGDLAAATERADIAAAELDEATTELEDLEG